MPRSALATVLCLSLGWAAAQEPSQPPLSDNSKVFLKWKFREGDTFYAVQNGTINQAMSLMGQDIEIKMKVQSVTRFRIKEVKKNATVIEMTLLKQKMEMDGPAGFPGVDIGEKLSNITFTFTVNDKMEVVKFEGYDKFLEALGGEDPMTAAMLRAMLPEATLKQSFGQTFSLAPDKPLAPGETWKHKDKMSLGPIGSLEIQSAYKLREVNGNLAKLSVTAEVKWTDSDAKMPQQFPFKVSGADIKSDKFDGTAVFNLDKGRLESVQMEMHIKGSLTVEVMNQKVDMDLKQQVRSEMKVVEKNPLKD